MTVAQILLLLAIQVFSVLVESADTAGDGTIGQKKCCPDGECYDIGPPWKSLIRIVPDPQCLNDSDVYFAFYTSETLHSPTNYTTGNMSSISSAFKPNNPTAIMFHGWMGSANETEVFKIVAAYLVAVPTANVFFCDWSKFSKTINYPQAASDIRAVARKAIKFLKYLMDNKGLPLSKIHVAGVSLGAQLSGYVGQGIPGIPRITGLDPAGPLFAAQDPLVRLSRSDGVFVEGINTNGDPFWGFGTDVFDLDVNFLISGGFDQPGCVEEQNLVALFNFSNWQNVNAGLTMAFCAHARSCSYYAQALRTTNCTFWGVPVTPIMEELTQLTLGFATRLFIHPDQCTKETCIPMGIDSVKSPLRGQFIVRVNRLTPFCVTNAEQEPWWQKLFG